MGKVRKPRPISILFLGVNLKLKCDYVDLKETQRLKKWVDKVFKYKKCLKALEKKK